MRRRLLRAATAMSVVAVGLVAPAPQPAGPGAVDIAVTEADIASVGGAHAEGRVGAASVSGTGGAEARTIKTDPFRMVAISATGEHLEGEDVLQIRTRNGDGVWSGWQDVAFIGDEAPEGAERRSQRQGWNWSAPIWTGEADRLQLRLPEDRDNSDQHEHDEVSLRRLRVHAIDVPKGDVRPPADSAYAMAPDVAVISRSQWGADESLRRGTPSIAQQGVKMAFVHHTVHSNSYGPDEADDIIRGIYAFHTQSRGWNDIGYNFLVDRFGRVYEGRAGGIDRAVIGAHAEGFNANSTGVAVLGDHSSVDPGAAVIGALQQFLAWKLDVHHVDPRGWTNVVSRGSPKFPEGATVSLPTISGHRDTGVTSCPGGRLYSALQTLRDGAAAIGLPKMYDAVPVFATAARGGRVDITARFSQPLGWTATITDSSGVVVATATGAGATAALSWNVTNLLGLYPGVGDYRWTITAAGAAGTARPATGIIRVTTPSPEGSIVRSSGASTTYFITGGRKVVLGSGDPLATRAASADIATISASALADTAGEGAPFRDGVLLRTPDHRIWLVADGVRRHIAGPAVYTGLGLNDAALRHVSEAAASVAPVGPALTSADRLLNGMFARTPTDPAIFRVVNGTLRHAPTPAVLQSFGVRPEEVAHVSAAQLAATGPRGGPLGFRDGSLIATPDAKVWAIADGYRRWIGGPPIFDALGLDGANIVRVSHGEAELHVAGAEVFEAAPLNGFFVVGGADVWHVIDGFRVPASWEVVDSFARRSEVTKPPTSVVEALPIRGRGWRDGTLLGGPDGTVYLVSRGQRRPISPTVRSALGMSTSSVRPATARMLRLHPDGPRVSSAAALVDGMFARRSGSSSVFLVSNGSARPVSAAVLRSFRVASTDVAVVDAGLLDPLPLGAPLPFREGTLIITPDGKLFLISGGQRRPIVHPEGLSALGYTRAGVVSATTAEAAVSPEGPLL